MLDSLVYRIEGKDESDHISPTSPPKLYAVNDGAAYPVHLSKEFIMDVLRAPDGSFFSTAGDDISSSIDLDKLPPLSVIINSPGGCKPAVEPVNCALEHWNNNGVRTSAFGHEQVMSAAVDPFFSAIDRYASVSTQFMMHPELLLFHTQPGLLRTMIYVLLYPFFEWMTNSKNKIYFTKYRAFFEECIPDGEEKRKFLTRFDDMVNKPAHTDPRLHFNGTEAADLALITKAFASTHKLESKIETVTGWHNVRFKSSLQ